MEHEFSLEVDLPLPLVGSCWEVHAYGSVDYVQARNIVVLVTCV